MIKFVITLAMIISALPWILIGISGVIYELFGPSGYDKFLILLNIKLTLGQIQLIGLISFIVSVIIFLLIRVLRNR